MTGPVSAADLPRRRSGTRHISSLALGSAASGLLAYVFFAVATRALGATAAAPVSVLWTYWSFAGAALTFPIQHWAARSVAAHDGEGAVRSALRGVAAMSLAVAVIAAGAAWLARHALFGSGAAWFPLLVGGVTLGSSAMGLVRGVLSARARFGMVAAGLFAENAVRCVVAGALVVADVRDPVAYGLALLAGYVVAGQPSAYLLGRSGHGPKESPFAFLGGAAGGQLLGQAVLTGGPVVLALAGGAPAEVTALFAALALFRAPYTLAVGVVAQVTGWLTKLVVERRVDALRVVRRRLLLLAIGCAVVAGVLGALLGRWVLRLVFGGGVVLDRGLVVVVAVGSAIAVANLVAALLVLAHGRTSRLVACWAIGLVPGAVCLGLPGLAGPARTCWAFLVIEAVVFALLLGAASRAGGSLASADPAEQR